jgi:hypothetical protein
VPLARVCVSCLCGWSWGPGSIWNLLYVVASFLCFGWFVLQRGFSAPVVFCVGLCSWVGSLSIHFGFLLDFLPLLPCSLSHLFVTHTSTTGRFLPDNCRCETLLTSTCTSNTVWPAALINVRTILSQDHRRARQQQPPNGPNKGNLQGRNKRREK